MDDKKFNNNSDDHIQPLDNDVTNIKNWKVFGEYTLSKLEEAVVKIQEFWEALGLDEEGGNIRRQNFALQFKEFIDKYVDSERLHNHFVQKSVLDVASQLEEIASALNYNSDISKKPLELLDELNKLMVDLKAEKLTRLSQYNELTSKIREMCTILDQHESIPKLNSFTKRFNGVEKSKYIPSNEEIVVLDNYLNNLNLEINQRKSELENVRGSILDILVKMGRNAEDPKYVPLFNSKYQNLSRSFIETIQRFHDELMDENNHYKEKYDNLWNEIEYWWEKLDTDILERDVIRLESIRENIIKERLSKIGQCVEKQRKILKNTLKNCYAFYNRPNADLWGGEEVLEMANTQFNPKDVVMNTEAYLIRLETAVDVATQYYNDNASFFNMVQRREQLWSELCTFESTPLTSERLRNRGGILLREEKIRKRIYKELPSLQQQLVIAILDWQNKYKDENVCQSKIKSRIFYWEDNVDYIEILRHQWENRIKLNKKLHHPDESNIYKSSKTTMMTPTRKAGADKCQPSPRTPLTSMSSFSSNSTRKSRVTKRLATPSTYLRDSNRNTPYSKITLKTPQRCDKLTFSSPVVDKDRKTPLLPLPNISMNENFVNSVPTSAKSKSAKKETPLRKPQLN